MALIEAGWVNTGLNRLYGRTRLSLLWKGIPADSATALELLLTRPPQWPRPSRQAGSLTVIGSFGSNTFNGQLDYDSLIESDVRRQGDLTLRWQSNFPGFERLNLQSRVILLDKNIYVQIPAALKLLPADNILDALIPSEAAGKFVQTDLPAVAAPPANQIITPDQLESDQPVLIQPP